MELWVMLVEMFVCLILYGCFVQWPKDENSRNDGSEIDTVLIWFWGIGIMGLSPIIVYCSTYIWAVYSATMLFLAFVIGRFEGFALPLFKDLGKNLWNGSNNVTVQNTRIGSVYFPGHSAVWVSIVGLVIFIILTIYSFHKAW